MHASALTTDIVPASRQYEAWRAAVRATHHAWDMPAASPGAFVGRVRSREVGTTELIACESDPCRGRRGRPELARTQAAQTGILFVLRGRERLCHPDGDTHLQAGQFTLWDTTRPLGFEVTERLEKLTWLVPTDLVMPALRHRRDQVRRTFDSTVGCGAILLSHLRTLASLPGQLGPAEERVALAGAVDLLSAALGGQLGGASVQAERLVSRAEAYMDAHLADPGLSLDAVADAIGVSRRTLDRAFADAGRSGARTLWERRLDRCRRDLLLERDTPVSQIAFRWGFNDAAHFSRAFRSAFGTSPSGYRAQGEGPTSTSRS